MIDAKFLKTINEKVMNDLGVKNIHNLPKLEKIIVSIGVGSHKESDKYIQEAESDLTKISGQKPEVRKARLSIAGFKLRKGQTVGFRVTLRGTKMWAFFERLVSVALPRVREFDGLSTNGFDGNGNYTLGIKEHIVFPEIDPNKMDFMKGLQVTLVTSSRSDNESEVLLRNLGLPLRNKK